MRGTLLIVAAALAVAACSSAPEKQWYKAGGYTVAEFQRDREACTKDRVVDEACLRGRGWIAISADEDSGPTPIAPAGLGSGNTGRRGGY